MQPCYKDAEGLFMRFLMKVSNLVFKLNVDLLVSFSFFFIGVVPNSAEINVPAVNMNISAVDYSVFNTYHIRKICC